MSEEDGLLKRWYVYRNEDGRAVSVNRYCAGPKGGITAEPVASRPQVMSFDDWNTIAPVIASAPALQAENARLRGLLGEALWFVEHHDANTISTIRELESKRVADRIKHELEPEP